MSGTTIRFGIVGCGFFGGEFARILQELEGTSVVAVQGGSGRSTARIAAEIGCDVEERLESLAARDDVDAILVASPNHLHREPVLQAARNGKHVFCEKPVALSSEDCLAMTEACRQAGVRFMAGHILHFVSGIEQIKRWIADGAIGRPVALHAERTGWEEPREEVSWKKNQLESGGHLFHHIHELDMAIAVMGPVSNVYLAADNVAHRGPGFGDEDDVLLLTLHFAGGGFGTLQFGSGFRWGEHYMKINGTEGAIKLDFRESVAELRRAGEPPVTIGLYGGQEDEDRRQLYARMDGGVIYGDPANRPPLFLRNVMKREIAAFRDAILGKPVDADKALLFDGTAANRSVAAAEAALQSKRLLAPVRPQTG
ncbi:Gfo/Idh/MocA family protein [Paenibacillus cymbidii]|uniref:Gfo/Idh/MocA family protein n=1 Tax=Paenibacillus cymbidii TaxID=1639034 RepID=UPI001080C24B|nr:Gfo/Idh/MocA family oxidoreductase [Paenibacillus cymbidii]